MTCGIRLTPSENSIAIISDDGDFIYRTTFPCPDDYTALLSQIASQVSTVCPEQDRDSAVGICIQGHEHTASGTVRSLHDPLIDNKPLRRDLQAVLNRPVIVASEGQCLASAARQQTRLSDRTTIFALSLDSFVCGGIIVDNRLLVGPHGLAGDWGHLSLPWPVDFELDGRECICGRTGCLEHFVSLPGLA
ncbi:MAG: ROK family protein, partial [Pseudomonadota bacterium]|nr:ROK family protein [Pseudomonadota bacterium]